MNYQALVLLFASLLDLPGKSLELNFVGEYVCRSVGTPEKEKWYRASLTFNEQRNHYIWTNGAGVSWTMYPDTKWELLVGSDCPFYKDGYRRARFNRFGMFGPFNNFYYNKHSLVIPSHFLPAADIVIKGWIKSPAATTQFIHDSCARFFLKQVTDGVATVVSSASKHLSDKDDLDKGIHYKIVMGKPGVKKYIFDVVINVGWCSTYSSSVIQNGDYFASAENEIEIGKEYSYKMNASLVPLVARESFSQCDKGAPQVTCLVDPCKHSTCPGASWLHCKPSTCGTCKAVYYDIQGNKVKNCVPQPAPGETDCRRLASLAKLKTHPSNSKAERIYIPQCQVDGSYKPKQCLRVLQKTCWCVDERTGVELPNTRRKNGRSLVCGFHVPHERLIFAPQVAWKITAIVVAVLFFVTMLKFVRYQQMRRRALRAPSVTVERVGNRRESSVSGFDHSGLSPRNEPWYIVPQGAHGNGVFSSPSSELPTYESLFPPGAVIPPLTNVNKNAEEPPPPPYV